ncbi:heme biosynthesis protein HemY [Francisella frigiditurris]|uniref:HemY family protein n=1 Tax=Francisella frigiditurris TaxID=1542390 RepID=A0A1J0KTK3_9GAMM|nr:heme biosynthesis protein HemY [Francisella frigiditurris]APC97081.1 hypothetical protein KX01_909 [Francisella frigiditurris]
MLKIFKFIVIIALATVLGLLVSKYDGYVMIVVAGKVIKLNLVFFSLSILVLIFLLFFAYRLVCVLVNIPIALGKWFLGLFSANKEQKFADIISGVSLGNKDKILNINLSKLKKTVPKDLQEYITFAKLKLIAEAEKAEDLEKEVVKLDPKSFIYRYFLIYTQALRHQYHEATLGINGLLLNEKRKEFKKEIVSLAVKIAIAKQDSEFAFKLLDRYSDIIQDEVRKDLAILTLTGATNLSDLKKTYNDFDQLSDDVEIAYASKLLKFDELKSAEKVLKKLIRSENVNPSALYIYVTAFSTNLSRVFSKVCNDENTNIDSMLVLLELAMIKSEKDIFKDTNEYIEKNFAEKMSVQQREKYNHILCKFFIKNGGASGIDLSVSKLVYSDQEEHDAN